MIAQLDSSYQWNLVNKGGHVQNIVIKAMTEGQVVTPEMMPTAMLKIKNKLKSIITSKVIECIDNGEITMIYTTTTRVPIYLPFILVRDNQNPNICKALVFLNACDASKSDDEINVDDRKLKVSLESAYFALKMFYMGDSPKIRTSEFIRTCSRVYASIVTECMNRKHSIKLDPDIYNSIYYMVVKYFVFTVLGAKDMSPEALQSYCLYNCKSPNLNVINHVEGFFDDSSMSNIGEFIKTLTEVDVLSRRLKNLNVSNFIESYINMYNASMLLSLELLPYLIYNILAVNESTFINNYGMMKNIVGQDGKKIYASLITTLSNY